MDFLLFIQYVVCVWVSPDYRSTAVEDLLAQVGKTSRTGCGMRMMVT